MKFCKGKTKIAKLRAKTGLSQSKFSELFGIPVRTLQQWEQGKSSPPAYVEGMMERLLRLDYDDARHRIPRKTRWRVCIQDPFPNCDRIYPPQQRKVRAVLDELAGNLKVRRVIVFGSSTTSQCHQGSDLDLYVDSDVPASSLLRGSYDFAMDIWDSSTVDDRLMDEIDRKGVVVYG